MRSSRGWLLITSTVYHTPPTNNSAAVNSVFAAIKEHTFNIFNQVFNTFGVKLARCCLNSAQQRVIYTLRGCIRNGKMAYKQVRGRYAAAKQKRTKQHYF